MNLEDMKPVWVRDHDQPKLFLDELTEDALPYPEPDELREIPLYTFSKLPKDVQTELLDKHRDCETSESFWFEQVIEDAKKIAEILGIDIDDVYWSGFCSQGDGACFVGNYSYGQNSLIEIKEHAPLDEELHRIAKELWTVQWTNDYDIQAITTTSRNNNMNVEVSCGWGDLDEDLDMEHIENTVTQALQDFATWIYRQLEISYDYYTSDDFVKDSIENQNWLFDIEGEQYD